MLKTQRLWGEMSPKKCPQMLPLHYTIMGLFPLLLLFLMLLLNKGMVAHPFNPSTRGGQIFLGLRPAWSA